MRKTLTFAMVAVLAFGAASWTLSQGGGSPSCPVDVIVHGTVRFVDVESGCWVFRGDDGNSYELITNRRNILRDGLTGTLYGTFLDLFTICQVGRPTGVCRFVPDNSQGGAGTVQFHPCLEGGCWTFTIGNTSYQPLSNDPSFFQHNAFVQAQFIERPDLLSFCQVGPIIEILDFTVLQEGEETPSCNGGGVIVE